jgi:hypothetical protein
MNVSAYAPAWLLVLPLGMVLFVAAVMFIVPATQGKRGVPLGLTAFISLVVTYFLFSPARFGWDETGIRDRTFMGEVKIPWSEVQTAEVVRGFRRTHHAPWRRTGGTGFPTYLSGHFDLSSGKGARIFVMREVPDALLLTTKDGSLYLYAPEHVDDLIAAAKKGTGLLD